jgi:hypothetical protein
MNQPAQFRFPVILITTFPHHRAVMRLGQAKANLPN